MECFLPAGAARAELEEGAPLGRATKSWVCSSSPAFPSAVAAAVGAGGLGPAGGLGRVGMGEVEVEEREVGDVLVLHVSLPAPPPSSSSSGQGEGTVVPAQLTITIRTSAEVSLALVQNPRSRSHRHDTGGGASTTPRIYTISEGGYSALLLRPFTTPAAPVDAVWEQGYLFLLDTQGTLRVWWCGEVMHALAPGTAFPLGPGTRLLRKWSLLPSTAPVLRLAQSASASLHLPPTWRRGGNVLDVVEAAGARPLSPLPAFHLTWWDGEAFFQALFAPGADGAAGTQTPWSCQQTGTFFPPTTTAIMASSNSLHHAAEVGVAGGEVIRFALLPPTSGASTSGPVDGKSVMPMPELLVWMTSQLPASDLGDMLAPPQGASGAASTKRHHPHHHGMGLAFFRRSFAQVQGQGSSVYPSAWVRILPPLLCRAWNVVVPQLRRLRLASAQERMAWVCKRNLLPLPLVQQSVAAAAGGLAHVPRGWRLERACLDVFADPEKWAVFLQHLSASFPSYSPFTPEPAPYASLAVFPAAPRFPLLTIPGRGTYLRPMDAVETLDAVLLGLQPPHTLCLHSELASRAEQLAPLLECLDLLTTTFDPASMEACARKLVLQHALAPGAANSTAEVLAAEFPEFFDPEILGTGSARALASQWLGMWRMVQPEVLAFLMSLLLPAEVEGVEQRSPSSRAMVVDGARSGAHSASLHLMAHMFPQFLSSRYHVATSLYVWLCILITYGPPEYPFTVAPNLVHVLGSVAHSYGVLMAINDASLLADGGEEGRASSGSDGASSATSIKQAARTRQQGVERGISQLSLKATASSTEPPGNALNSSSTTTIWAALLQHHYPPTDEEARSWDLPWLAGRFLRRLDLVQATPSVTCTPGVIALLQKGLAFQWSGNIMDALCSWYPDFRIICYARGMRCLGRAARGEMGTQGLPELYDAAAKAFRACGAGPIEGHDLPGVPHPLVGVRLHKSVLDAFDHHIPAQTGPASERKDVFAIEAAQRGLSLALLQGEEEWTTYFHKRLASLLLRRQDWAGIIALLGCPDVQEELRRDILKQSVSLLIYYSATPHLQQLIPYAADVLVELEFKCHSLPDADLLQGERTDVHDILCSFHLLLHNYEAAAQVKLDYVDRVLAARIAGSGDAPVKWTRISQALLACISCIANVQPRTAEGRAAAEEAEADGALLVSRFWHHIMPAPATGTPYAKPQRQVWGLAQVQQAYWYALCVLKVLNARRRLCTFTPREVLEACCALGEVEDALMLASHFPGELEVQAVFPSLLAHARSREAGWLALQRALTRYPGPERWAAAGDAVLEQCPAMERLPPWLAASLSMEAQCTLYLRHDRLHECARLLQAHVQDVVGKAIVVDVPRAGARAFPVGVLARLLEEAKALPSSVPQPQQQPQDQPQRHQPSKEDVDLVRALRTAWATYTRLLQQEGPLICG